MKNIIDLRKEDVKSLNEKIKNFRKEALNLRFQKSSGQLENTSRISKVKKEIARIKTIINEKKKV
jgi:large subunit ribosomal protein L29|tara:strand:+ start:501 stop:695 length:195 start_codon:yes stop_codon:yes gene_type:complete